MKAEILIDFLTFSVQGGRQADDVVESVLGMDTCSFEHLAKGFNFYSKSLVYNDIRVLYDGIGEKMGVCVNMSGRGCRSFEEYGDETILSLLNRINQDPNINITRIDIACDDKYGALDLSVMWAYANEGNYRTRLLSRNNHESFKTGQSGAKTIYFGSPSSLYRIRIYDKAKQTGEAGHWVRFEITLKDDYAAQAVNLLMENENLGAAVSGIIDEKFAFIEKEDSNISRCKYADWWADFLGEIDSVKMTSKQKFIHGIDEHKKWLRESCGRIIAKVYCAIGRELFFAEIIKYGKSRFSDADISMVEDYKRRIKGGSVSNGK